MPLHRPEPAAWHLMPAVIDERIWQVRFLFPVLPLFNIGAAVAAARIASGRHPLAAGRAAHLGCCSALATGFLVTLLMTAASRNNYPGGEAMPLRSAPGAYPFHRLRVLYKRPSGTCLQVLPCSDCMSWPRRRLPGHWLQAGM